LHEIVGTASFSSIQRERGSTSSRMKRRTSSHSILTSADSAWRLEF